MCLNNVKEEPKLSVFRTSFATQIVRLEPAWELAEGVVLSLKEYQPSRPSSYLSI